MVSAWLCSDRPAGRCTAGGELAEAVEHFGLFAPLAEVTVQPQGLLVAGFGGRVVADQLLQHCKLAAGPDLLVAVAEVTVPILDQPQAGFGGRVVTG